MSKTLRTVAIGAAAIAVLGVIVRLSAHDLAFPESYSYRGDITRSSWAIAERALIDVSYALMAFGLAAALIVVHRLLADASRARGP